jgi:hypothetical protein
MQSLNLAVKNLRGGLLLLSFFCFSHLSLQADLELLQLRFLGAALLVYRRRLCLISGPLNKNTSPVHSVLVSEEESAGSLQASDQQFKAAKPS